MQNETKRIFTIGLTGGIGSGKTTIRKEFERLGVWCLDADKVAREVVEPNSPGLLTLVRAFGNEILEADGTLNRKYLGSIVFKDKAKLERLNQIMFPLIRLKTKQHIREYTENNKFGGVPYIIYESALLVENATNKDCSGTLGNRIPDIDFLVVVAADEQTQVRRVMARDGLTEPEALARLKAQASLDTKLALADFAIWNSNDSLSPRDQVQTIHLAIMARIHRIQHPQLAEKGQNSRV